MHADIQATQQRHSNRFQEVTDMLGTTPGSTPSTKSLDTVLELLKGRETSGD